MLCGATMFRAELDDICVCALFPRPSPRSEGRTCSQGVLFPSGMRTVSGLLACLLPAGEQSCAQPPFYKCLHQQGERKANQVVLLKGGARKPPGPPWGCKSCVRVEASHPEQEGELCHLCGSPSQPAGVCLEWTGPAGSARLVLVQPGWELVWVELRRMWGWEQRWEGPDVLGRLSCLQKSCE